MYNDTIVTLIGKPLPAKMDVFLQLHKKSPCFQKSGWKRRHLGSFFTQDSKSESQIRPRLRDVFETLAIADHHFRS